MRMRMVSGRQRNVYSPSGSFVLVSASYTVSRGEVN